MKQITIYTTPTCVYCKMARAYFKEHDIPYEEKDVTANEHDLEEMIKKSGQLGVPVIDIGGEIVVGFDKPIVEKLVGS